MSLAGNIEPNLAHKKYSKKTHLLFHPMLHAIVGMWIFSSGFVMFEPSPFELLFFLVLPIALIARVGLHQKTIGLFSLILLFIPFAIIAAFQVTFIPIAEAMFYTMVTIFLFLTAFFIANYVADSPFDRMKIIMNAYLAAALITATIGILAYLKIIPGEDVFLRYGRAKAFFKDPNVYGPFLILPAMFMLQRLFLLKFNKAILPAIFFAILSIGIFVSFSRAAWGSLLLSSFLVFVFSFALHANARQKVYMIILATIAIIAGLIALFGLLSIPSVNKLFFERASLVQSYDGGETGRFARQTFAVNAALENPLGQGPKEFGNLIINSEPHNTYINVILVYGWAGGLAFILMILSTLKVGIGALLKKSKNQVLMTPLIATFISLAIEAAIIDTDHWRYLFVLVGLIWGVWAGYYRINKKQTNEKTSLI